MIRPQKSFSTLHWPQKVKMNPKIKSKSKVRIEGTIENKSFSTTWVDPKTVFEPYPDQQNSPLRPQKFKIDSKIKSKSKVKIEGTIEKKSCSTIWADPKTVFEPYLSPKDDLLVP